MNSPSFLALGVSEGLSGQKERSGIGDVGTQWELPGSSSDVMGLSAVLA